jgi:hypothetical protein
MPMVHIEFHFLSRCNQSCDLKKKEIEVLSAVLPFSKMRPILMARFHVGSWRLAGSLFVCFAVCLYQKRSTGDTFQLFLVKEEFCHHRKRETPSVVAKANRKNH